MWRKRFKFTSLILTISLFISATKPEDVVDCTNEDIVTSIFNDPIELTHNGTIRVYENLTINEISATSNNEFDKNYIDARLVDNLNNSNKKTLIIFTTNDFANYAVEQTAVRISLKITLGCDMGRMRTLIFFQPIKEGNYFAPVFSKKVYELTIPTPIFAGFDLTIFADISAKDDDLINNQITFSSKDADDLHISVGTENITSDDKKTYYAHIILSRIFMALENELRFEIIATDNGVPSLSSNATVIVRADPLNSLPPTPLFSQSIYHANLNADLTMEPFQIELKADTFSNDVNFSASGKDQSFFSLDTTNNIVNVKLKTTLNRTVLGDAKYLEFDIKAVNKKLADYGNIAVIVEIPNVKEYFHFARQLYEGVIDKDGKLDLEVVVFNISAYSADMTFELIGMMKQYFTLQQTENILQLKLAEDFLFENWMNKPVILLEIQAKLNNLVATTAIVINLEKDEVILVDKLPEFEKPLYVGEINEYDEIQIEPIILLANTFEVNKTKFSLNGTDSDSFELIVQDNGVQLLLKDVRPITPTTIALILKAENNNLKGYASVLLNSAKKINYIQRIFAKYWFTGNIDKDSGLHLNAISLAANYKVSEFMFTLVGDEARYFTIALDELNNKIVFGLRTSIPAEIAATKSQIIMQLNAESLSEFRINDTTLILIQLPNTECSTPAPPTFVPQFYSSEYIFTIKPNHTGALGQVSATIVGSNAALRYSISAENEQLQKRLVINTNTGELMLLSYISPGIYYFSIIAENSDTFSKASAKGRLEVNAVLQCDRQGPTVSNSLLVKYIEEEEIHANLLNMTVESCNFKISHMYPNDKEYVYTNETTKMLTTIVIDREDDIFANMSVPQIQIKLELICDSIENNGTMKRRRRAIEMPRDEYSLVMVQDIPYSSAIMLLNLIIVDINDNAPKFVYPSKPTHLGYPESRICMELFPQQLTQVQAQDRDVGLNAQIRYSIRSNKHFNIDPTSGVIYPKENALQTEESTELIVLATDRNGAKDGLSTGIVLLVHRLSKEYFSMLTFKGPIQKSIEATVAELSDDIGYSITIIKYATIPGNSSVGGSRRLRRQTVEESVVQKVWIYTFANNQPITCDQLQKKILSISNTDRLLTVESFDEVGLNSNQSYTSNPVEEDHPIFIATIVILAVISVASLSFMIWRFYLQDRCNKNRLKAPISNICMDNEESKASNGIKADEFECIYPSAIKSKSVENIPPPITNVVDKSPASWIEADNKRSQVKFNEVVERIHIDVADEPEASNSK